MSFARSRSFLSLLIAFFACATGSLRAAIVVDGSPKFVPAQTTRTYMDRNTVANAWTGSALTAQGDRFSITLRNTDTSNAAATGDITVTLPTDFARVGSATPAATDMASSFKFVTSNIPAGGSITYTFGLRTTAAPGTHTLTYAWTGGSATQEVLVQAGAYVIEANPTKLSLQINASGTYEYTVTNTGLGGLFNLQFIENGNPGTPGTAWKFDSFGARTISGSPGTTANTAGAIVTINYLAPGGSVKIPVKGTVQDCFDIRNVYSTSHNLAAVISGSTPIELDITKPLLSYTLPDIQLKYGVPVTVSIPLQNTGNGDATEVTVSTNLYAAGVTIVPGSDWTYNAVTGVFALTANSKRIPNATTRNLTFTALANSACDDRAGEFRYVVTTVYKDPCNNPYSLPTRLAVIKAPDDKPSLTVTRVLPNPEVRVGQPGSYTLRVNTSLAAKFVSPSDLLVTDIVPAEFTPDLPLVPGVGTATFDPGTRLITWTIPVANLANTQSLTIPFTVDADDCIAGLARPGTVMTSELTTAAGCVLSAQDSATFYLSSPGLGGSGTIIPELKVGTPASGVGGSFETGVATTNGTRELGEGEFISIEATYVIGTDYRQGLWSATTFTDDFGEMSGARIVPGSLEIIINGAAGIVPASHVTSSASSHRLEINLAFLEGYFGSNAVSGESERTIKFRYKLTATNADLAGGAQVQNPPGRQVTQRTNLVVGSSNNFCSTKFEKWVIYIIGHASAGVLIEMPPSIELCEDFQAVITVKGGTSHAARNIRVSLLTEAAGGKYSYVVGSAVYGGAFASGTMTPGTATDGPTFSWNGALANGASGTIQVTLRRKQAPAPAPLDTVVAPPLEVRLAYDDNETAPAAGRAFNDSSEIAPAVVRAADLQLFATPQSVLVIDQNVSWTAYVTNAGNGTARGVIYRITFPQGIVPSNAATFATAITNANTAGGFSIAPTAITISGQLVTMNLGSLASGLQIKLPLSGALDGTQCTFNSAAYAMEGEWGCNNSVIQMETVNNPAFVQPAGDIQIVHDTRSKATLCAQSEIVIVVKNVGLPALRDLKIAEVLGASGLTYVAGSTKYATNLSAHNLSNGATWPAAAADPTSVGSTLTWDKIALPVLGKIVGSTSGSTTEPHTVYIRFLVQSSESTNAFSGSINANLLEGKLPCGSMMPASPGTAYSLPVEKPNITLVKTGRNLTAGDTAWTKTVYGGKEDVIEWKVEITNNGNFEARLVKLKHTAITPGRGDVRFAGAGYSAGSGALNYATNTTAYVNGTELPIATLPKAGDAGNVATYYFLEKLTGTCVADDESTASVNWGCTTSSLATPTDNSDSTRLIMRGTFGSGAGVFTQTFNQLTNGRLQSVITLKNAGGTIKDLALTLALTNGLTIDTSVPPSIAAVNTSTNTTEYTNVSLNTAAPSEPVLTLSTPSTANAMRFGETVAITVYYMPAIVADTLANEANPTMDQVKAYKMPETVENGLDPVQPVSASVTVTANFKSTCGDNGTPVVIQSTPTTAIPDLDITVSPTPVQLIAAQAPYTYIFDYTIVNNGAVNSVAENILFRLHSVGIDWQAVSAVVLSSQGSGAATNAITTTAGSINLGKLGHGQSAIVRVTATTKAYDNVGGTPKADNLVLVGEVEGSVFNQAVVDTNINYSLDRAAPIVSDNFNISGWLYMDANRNGFRDTSGTAETGAGIPGLSGPSRLYAKLINTASPGVAVAAVPLGSLLDSPPRADGYYAFENAAAPGTYRIIISGNATLTDVSTAVISGYLGTEAPGLSREVVVGVTSVYNQNFGVWRGAKLTGTVFKDTGEGAGGVANDGLRNGDEAGIPSVTVKATNAAGTVTHDATVTAGDGTYTLWVPSGVVVRIVETNLADYLSTGAVAGDTTGTIVNSDTISFTPVAGTTYSGLNFGDVPPNAFLTDGTQTILPGATATYPHTYIARTGGSVTFSAVVSAVSPANIAPWGHVLYHDLNRNGEADATDPILTPTDVLVPALDPTDGQFKIWLVLKQFAPVAAPLDARNTVTVTATFSYANRADLPANIQMRQDLTITGVNGAASLDLVKEVNVAEATPGTPITYTITYTNKGAEPLKNVVIHDQVPAFTMFDSATAGTPGTGLTIDLSNPPANIATQGGITRPQVGKSGAIVWTFFGELAPGGSGTVSFVVKVLPMAP